MKIKEMQKICHDHKGKCDNCPLLVNENWMDNLESWCLIYIKQDYIRVYQGYKAEGNMNLAERVMQRYKEIEQKAILKGV